MSRVCEFCGKKTHYGKSISRRGLPIAKGGVGLKTTGITRRTFKPNIQRVRAKVNGGVKRVKICASCLKLGRVQKP
ncbi:MAG: 50S ribosomal protein L28 [Planctomycetota bacterium]